MNKDDKQFFTGLVSGLKTDLQGEIKGLEQRLIIKIEGNTEAIRVNGKVIRVNTKGIKANTKAIQSNAEAIKANAEGIQANTKAIQANAEGIRENRELIRNNAEGIRENRELIRNNAEGIRENRELIRANAEGIQANTQEIQRNGVLLEDVQDKVQLLAEGQSCFKQLIADMAEVKERTKYLPELYRTVQRHDREIKELQAKAG